MAITFNGTGGFIRVTGEGSGTQGPQGPQGPQGQQGSQGPGGTVGLQGAQGTQGLQGDRGIQGAQGAQGTQGNAASGTQGVQGSQGPQGVQGTVAASVQGPQGSQGIQGDIGDGGTVGNQGAQGSQGATSYLTKVSGDSAVKLLLHFDGANGSSTFTDDSYSPLAPSVASGTVQLSTSQSKFGGSSLYLNGTGTNVLRVTNTNSKISLGTNAFTIEGWFYFNVQASTRSPAYVPLLSFTTSGDVQGPVLFQNNNNEIRWVHSAALGQGSWTVDLTTTSAGITTGAWHHIAVVGTGTNIKIFINGTQRATSANGNIYTGDYFYIGHYPYIAGSTPVTFNGYIDDLRVSDTARYSDTFTPSASAFPTGAISVPSASAGEKVIDDYYIYVCTNGASNTWKRARLSSLY